MTQRAKGKNLPEPRPQQSRVPEEENRFTTCIVRRTVRPGPLVWIASAVEPCLDGDDITATRGDS